MPVNDGSFQLELSAEEIATLRAALRRYLLHWEEHQQLPPGTAHSTDELTTIRHNVGRLLWRLETPAISGDSRVQHSAEAVDPLGVPVGEDWVIATRGGWARMPTLPRAGVAETDQHAFLVQPRVNGRWAQDWRPDLEAPDLFRGMCTCGWLGKEIAVDQTCTRDDTADREEAYEDWLKRHLCADPASSRRTD